MKNNLTFHPKLVFRTPLLGQKYSLTISEIDHFLKQDLVQEAIFLASPDFYKTIQRYLNNELTTPKEVKKIRITAYKYLIRMMNRPTPFGLFAACSVANWHVTTDIQLPSPTKIIRKPRIEVTFLATLMEKLTSTQAVQKTLSYQLNDTIYSFGNKVTYIKLHDTIGARTPAIEVANLDEYLALVLKESKKGIKLATLVEKLQQLDATLPIEDIYDYLKELIKAQILTNEWLPNVTGLPYFQKILAHIDKNKGDKLLSKNIIQSLQQINVFLSNIAHPAVTPILTYQKIYKIIQQLHPRWPPANTLQLDSFKKGKTEFFLTNSIQQNLLEAVKFLTHFRPSLPLSHLALFKQKFKLKYDKQEVPLLELMDVSIGLGYPIETNKINNFLLANIPITSQKKVKKEQLQPTTKSLHRLLVTAHKKNQYETDIATFIDLKEFSLPNNLPPSKSLVFTIEGEKDNEPVIYVKYLGASSGANLINRFAHGHPEIAEIIQSLGQHEASQLQDGVILAEVVHFPEFGAGNLLCRPAFRHYEIPYLCQSGVPKAQQISLTDLTVSLINDQWILRSKKLDKIVLPRISNSHDFQKNIHPVYRFLGDLQYQSSASSRLFSWGLLQDLFHFFPRIFYKNIILSRACWRLTKAQYPAQDMAAINAWRKKWNIPKYIAYGNWSQELIIDLSNPIAVDLFIASIKNLPVVLFYEVIFDEKTCPIKDVNGKAYTNEFIATILNNTKQKYQNTQISALKIKRTENTLERSFMPGSNWVYFKIYCSPIAANNFLLDYLYPFIQHLFKKKMINNCFFIRYKDDFDHLRIRVLLNANTQMGIFMQALHQLVQQAKTEKIIWKFQLDTYERELERYGNSIAISETIFGIDSTNVLQVLQLVKKNGNNQLYWQFSILAINQYLEAFPVQARREFAAELINRLGDKFSLNQKEITLQLNKKYRKLRPAIFQLFNQKHPNSSLLTPLLSQREILFQTHFVNIKNNFLNDYDLIKNHKLKTLITSYIHLTINRLYSDQQPYNEFVLYYLLEKHYTSMIALDTTLG